MKMKQLQRSKNQRGAVLLVSLIMLLITTFVGFSTMETSNLEAKMATSREIKELTFQAAETAIDITLDTETLIGEAYNAGLTGGDNPTGDYQLDDDDMTSEVEVQYWGDFHTPGFSIVEGDGGGTKMATIYYTVVGTGGRTNTNIESEHTQGIFVVQPKAN